MTYVMTLLLSTFVLALSPVETSKKPQLSTMPLSNIRAGQLGVGHEYAFYKALLNASLNPDDDWKTLSKKEKQKLINSVNDELSQGIPVFIAPNKNIYAIDQHHDMFVLQTLMSPLDVEIPIDVIRDFSKEKLTDAEFKKTIKDKGWVYEKYLNQVLDHPVLVKDLVDTPERSVVGMAFLHFEENENIPLKGKYFVPFIQFLLIDFLKDNHLMSFHYNFSEGDVNKIVEILRNDADVKDFLKSHLVGKAPQELKEFLTP